MSKYGGPIEVFKKGQTVEVKGDQIGGGITWALYWFRGKVAQVNKKRGKSTYNVKMLDPTRFNQKSLTVRDLHPRYMRSLAVEKNHTVNKKNNSPRKYGTSGVFAEAGSEGSVCESWEDTLKREAAEKAALKGAIKKRKRKKKGIPEDEEAEEDGEVEYEVKTGFDEKYKKGVDIRRKVDEIKTDTFHLIDRNKLLFGDVLFQTGDKIFYREQVYDLRRIRMYKERPVLILENQNDGIRRAEVKDCEVDKSVDVIRDEIEEAKKKAAEDKATVTTEVEKGNIKDEDNGFKKNQSDNVEKQAKDDVAKGYGDLSLKLIPDKEEDVNVVLSHEESQVMSENSNMENVSFKLSEVDPHDEVKEDTTEKGMLTISLGSV